MNKEYFQNFKGSNLMKGHTGAVTGIDICKHRNLLASGSKDGTVKLWSRADNSLIKTYSGDSYNYNVVFSNEGNLLAFGGGWNEDNSIKLIDISDLQKSEVIYKLYGHLQTIWRIKFSNDSKYLVSGSEDQTVRVWSLDLKQEVFQFNQVSSVNGIAFNSNDTLLAVNSSDKKIRILDFKNKKLLFCQDAHQDGQGIQFSSDDKMLVSYDDFGTIKLWSLSKLNQHRMILIRNLKASTKCLCYIHIVLFSPCSNFIIIFSNLWKMIKILDSLTGEVVKELQTNQTNYRHKVDLAISKDGHHSIWGE